MATFVVGQRFVSEAEPELGLGCIERVESRRVLLRFPASDTLREYAASAAPIRRVAFRVGDEVEDRRGRRFRIERVEVDRDGLFVYRGKRHRVPETELSGQLTFSKPEDRLLAGLWDRSRQFDLRRRALGHRLRILRSPARGFLGGRIELVPHQLYIAQEIASRPRPRALLADEVGLGKTIEAGLILHRLLRSGQMARALVLVPESLVHQWFVEMFRRFHLSFTIVDERYCRETEEEQDANPFLLTQTAIASLAFLAGDPLRREQARDAGWDMLVVDEAHHLAWSREGASPEYALVDAISRRARGLLLLTATPEQLGAESHFARLRLLDPERYTTFDRYRKDHDRYRFVADVAGKLLDGGTLTRGEERELGKLVPVRAKQLRRQLKAFMAGDEGLRGLLVASLVDQHGPGRVVFRNTRKVLAQFPERKVVPASLEWPSDMARQRRELAREYLEECGEGNSRAYDYSKDVRALWLMQLLKQLQPDKVLVICRFKERAMALQEALRRRLSTPVAVFHEELSLLQRDRNAAWFADERDGAQALLCSEIGSEGRNFQFAHHLVLFDLPLIPELLEQRIGRLDRIGQERTVRIHVPYLPGTAQEMVFRWYQEGLDAFEHSLVGSEAFDALAARMKAILVTALDRELQAPSGPEVVASPELTAFLRETSRIRDQALRELQEGRDRLLDLSSFRAEQAAGLIAEIRRWDEDRELDRFLVDALDYLGVEIEEISKRTFVLRQGNELVVEPLPGLRSDEVGMTCDRERATHQGELDLLTWDHPMVNGVLEILLGAEHGSSAVALLASHEPGVLLETLFVLETVASPELRVARFLPPTPLRVVIDHRLADVTDEYPVERLERNLVDGRRESRFADLSALGDLVPRMLGAARGVVKAAARERIEEGLATMRETLGAELARLRLLAEVNDHVHPGEIAAAEREMTSLEERMRAARPRLDAVRLIRRGSVRTSD